MSVKLNSEQLIELKQAYLSQTVENVSWSELADADELVTDEVVFAEYSDVDFVQDDFFCSL